MKNNNIAMMTDFYEFTMANGYFENDLKDKIVCFDMFFRRNPDNAGFAITAGLEQLIQYIKGLRFDKEDIESRSNARVDFKMQLQEQFKYPIVLITTQKYFKMNDEERKMLYKWKNGSRSIKIIDEKPYILATTTIDEDAFWNSENVTIYTPAGSYAESFAIENNIPYVNQ